MKLLVVGGVAGGASAAARVRRLDPSAEVIVFDRGDYVSYSNCSLPYYLGGTVENDQSLIGTFGFQSGRDADKYDGTASEMKDGVPIVTDACGWFTCKVVDMFETSTHTIFLGEVTDGDVLSSAAPMTYAYYHNVIKGKSPKNAPTYLPEEDEAEPAADEKWVCSICGYVYDGDVPFEDLPDDWKCPVCKQPKNVFEKK